MMRRKVGVHYDSGGQMWWPSLPNGTLTMHQAALTITMVGHCINKSAMTLHVWNKQYFLYMMLWTSVGYAYCEKNLIFIKLIIAFVRETSEVLISDIEY